MKKKGAAVIIVLLLLWIVLAAQINNEFMLPLPFDVFKQMLVQLTSP
ncbi:MAG: ABC transporter permease, partial [Dielma fastidiosa]